MRVRVPIGQAALMETTMNTHFSFEPPLSRRPIFHPIFSLCAERTEGHARGTPEIGGAGRALAVGAAP
jgi:hypothetical protein